MILISSGSILRGIIRKPPTALSRPLTGPAKSWPTTRNWAVSDRFQSEGWRKFVLSASEIFRTTSFFTGYFPRTFRSCAFSTGGETSKMLSDSEESQERCPPSEATRLSEARSYGTDRIRQKLFMLVSGVLVITNRPPLGAAFVTSGTQCGSAKLLHRSRA